MKRQRSLFDFLKKSGESNEKVPEERSEQPDNKKNKHRSSGYDEGWVKDFPWHHTVKDANGIVTGKYQEQFLKLLIYVYILLFFPLLFPLHCITRETYRICLPVYKSTLYTLFFFTKICPQLIHQI